jgi:hypothetical protein
MQRRKKNLEEMLNAGLLSHAFPNVSRVLKGSKVKHPAFYILKTAQRALKNLAMWRYIMFSCMPRY